MNEFNKWLEKNNYGHLGDGGYWLSLDRGFPNDSIWLDSIPATEKMLVGYMMEYIVSVTGKICIDITKPVGEKNTYKLMKKIIVEIDKDAKE